VGLGPHSASVVSEKFLHLAYAFHFNLWAGYAIGWISYWAIAANQTSIAIARKFFVTFLSISLPSV